MMLYSSLRTGAVGLALAVSVLLYSSVSRVAEVTMGVPVTSSDGGVTVPVTWTPGAQEDVAALQFDLRYDAAQYGFTALTAGDAIVNAGKQAVFSEPEPGVVRVVVAGFNQQALGAGTVATLHFQPSDKADDVAAFSAGSSLEQVLVSDPFGGKTDAAVANLSESESEPADTRSEGKSADGSASRTSTEATAASQSPSASMADIVAGLMSPGKPQAAVGLPLGTMGKSPARRESVIPMEDGAADRAFSGATGARERPSGNASPVRPASSSSDTNAVESSAGRVSAGSDQLTHAGGGASQRPSTEPLPASAPSAAARWQVAGNVSAVSRAGSVTTALPSTDDGPVHWAANPPRSALIGASAVMLLLVLGMWVFNRT